MSDQINGASKRNIMIVNGWSDMNRGDSAILLGMIHLIRKVFPDHSICVMSEFGTNDPNFASSYWVIKLYHSEVEILPALFPYPRGSNKLQKMIDAILIFVVACLTLIFPMVGCYFFWGTNADTWKRVVESDALLSKGGHVFYLTQRSFRSLYGFFKHAFPLLLGARLEKKTALYAQSVGPFRGRISQFLARLFFNRLNIISVREEISLNVLQNLGVVRPIYFVPDAAFVLSKDRKDLISEESTVIVTPRQWGFHDNTLFQNYIKALSVSVEWLSSQGYKVLLVNHTIGPTPSEEDSVAVRSLYEAIKLKENVEVIDTHGLTPYDLISLYTSARLLIGTRFHSVIFALLSGTPVVAISYFGPKTFGIMKSLGLEQFALDIGKANAEELKSTIQYVLEHEDQIRKEISVRVERLRKEAIRAGTAFLELLLKEK